MLSMINAVTGRPWAIRADLAQHARGILTRDGLAGLRHLAELKLAAHSHDERLQAARGGRAVGAADSVIAVIPVMGVLTQRGDVINSAETRSTARVAAEVSQAAANSEVNAILLEVDSPGGEVFGVPEAWAAIRQAAKSKPVVAVANSQAASAALWLASAASEFYVTPSGEAGSLGVYALHVDASKALEQAGERYTFITAADSPFKVEGNYTEPLSDDARAEFQKGVDRYMGMFVRDVAKGRGLSEKAVLKNFGQGRMLSPAEAVAARMVDGIGTFEQALLRAAELGRKARSTRQAGRASNLSPVVPHGALLRQQAGISTAPGLTEGTPERSCMNCEYYSRPSQEHDGGACSRHDFHAMDMWVCEDWEARGAEAPAHEEPVPVHDAAAAERRLAQARLASE